MKLFGVFDGINLDRTHPITGEFDDIFYCPQSRYACIDDTVLEHEKEKGKINLLVFGKEDGYFIFESTDQRFIAHLGHPEYNSSRLVEEYQRDKMRGIKNLMLPLNFEINNPKNRWRSHRYEFFYQWIKYVYDNTVL